MEGKVGTRGAIRGIIAGWKVRQSMSTIGPFRPRGHRDGQPSSMDRGWTPFPFSWRHGRHFAEGGDGLVNAPTGSGKDLQLPRARCPSGGAPGGLRVLWITPIRALAKEIHGSASRFSASTQRLDGRGRHRRHARLRKSKGRTGALPEVLITTPESLHVLLAKKGGEALWGPDRHRGGRMARPAGQQARCAGRTRRGPIEGTVARDARVGHLRDHRKPRGGDGDPGRGGPAEGVRASSGPTSRNGLPWTA